MSIMDKLKKNSKLKKHTSVLSESKFFDEIPTTTSVPMINVALSGSLDGGLSSGLTVIAGPSKHFKTSFALLMAAAYLLKNPESVLLFYDSEFGSPKAYFAQYGIDTDRVLHTPITNVEELKFDMISQFEEMDRTDDVIVIIDSVGNLASKKELEDAMNEKSVADMTRAKQLKSLFRMATPYLKMKKIPLIAINHTYKEIGLFPKDIVSGGTGIYYSADNIWIVGRRQVKEGTEISGYDFVINIEKSRYVKEKSKIPISVSWEGGVETYSGLLDLALAGDFVVKPKAGWYAVVDPETGEILEPSFRKAATMNGEFWDQYLNSPKFQEFVKHQYTIGHKSEVVLVDIIVDHEAS